MVQFAIGLYIIGLLVFYTEAQFQREWWKEAYYIWDKGKDVLLFTSLYLLINSKYKWALKLIIAFSLIRFVWQIISSITGWNINNVKVVGWLFIVLALICSFMTLKDFIKWRK